MNRGGLGEAHLDMFLIEGGFYITPAAVCLSHLEEGITGWLWGVSDQKKKHHAPAVALSNITQTSIWEGVRAVFKI